MVNRDSEADGASYCERSGNAPTFDWERKSEDEVETGLNCEYCGAPVEDKHCHGRCPYCGYHWSCSDGGGLRE